MPDEDEMTMTIFKWINNLPKPTFKGKTYWEWAGSVERELWDNILKLLDSKKVKEVNSLPRTGAAVISPIIGKHIDELLVWDRKNMLRFVEDSSEGYFMFRIELLAGSVERLYKSILNSDPNVLRGKIIDCRPTINVFVDSFNKLK